MSKIIIIAIVYLEPEWQETKSCIEATGLPTYYVQRNPAGKGSLSEAINRGFLEAEATEYDYAWIITNITFDKDVPFKLANNMKISGLAAIHPSFESDHIHQRPDNSNQVKIAPFIEFTAAMVRTDLFAKHMLDVHMPYWGHDLDWGYRMCKYGSFIAVDHSCSIGHIYIRHNDKGHPITAERLALRKATNKQTKRRLIKKYGAEWRDIVFPKTEQQIGAFYDQVKEKILLSLQH